jgi:hypothetical protein
MTQGNRDPLSSPLSLTDKQQRRTQAMDTPVPDRSETPAGAALFFSLWRRTAVSKASRQAFLPVSHGLHGHIENGWLCAEMAL